MSTNVIFPRPPSSVGRLSGTEIAGLLLTRFTDRFEREEQVFKWVLEGNVPEFMDTSIGVDMGGGLTIFVVPDFLCLGTDDDFVRVPTFPTTAQRIADVVDCVLPTTKISDAVWRASLKVDPMPWGPPYDASMMSSSRIVEHNRRIDDGHAGVAGLKSKCGYSPGVLVSGHKKDVVITNDLLNFSHDDARVAIHGWHKSDGRPIQGLYLGHESHYADYSHGIRFISTMCLLHGVETRIDDVGVDPKLCALISREGVIRFWKYSTT